MRELSADVLVVGGGPAGVAAAVAANRAGLEVLIVEKDQFPRAKPCAGAVSISALNRLSYDITPVTRASVSEFRLSRNSGHDSLISARRPVIAMTRRSELDQFGLESAMNEGSRLIVLNRVANIEQDRTGVILRGDNIKMRAKFLVAADGANSRIRRILFPDDPRKNAIAIEADVDSETIQKAEATGTRIDFGAIRGGYGWVFPKGDHVNVGLYAHSFRFSRNVSKKLLSSYTGRALGTEKIDNLRGFPITTFAHRSRIASGRVLFVGDAGGFSDAISGEGIFGAVLSGQLAASSIIKGGDVAASYRDIITPYVRRCRISRALAGPFYGALPFFYPIFANRLATLAARLEDA
jgi:geranylgeranyl reductase family protein